MTAKESLEARDKILDEYEKNLGLPAYSNDIAEEELQAYLNMDRKSIEALSGEDCAIIAVRLNQFSFHMQRAQNRELARVSWAKNEIRITIANELNNYKGYGYEEKSSQAIKQNDHANKLNQIMVFAQQRAERLNFLSNGMRNIADMLKSVQYNKRQTNE